MSRPRIIGRDSGGAGARAGGGGAPDPALLWPAPRRVELTGERLELGDGLEIRTGAQIAPALERRLAAALEGAGGGAVEPGRGARLALAVEPGIPAQGYRLSVGGAGARIVAADRAGLYYGACTLAQWIELHRGAARGRVERLAGLEIEDRPDLAVRGVMLDVSRNKVPTLPTLLELVDRLAGWKINQLQLYMEHTFAYAGHEEVWRDASPFTGAEIEKLDRWCAERCVELVPNQNSFGHFHRWLRHDAYRPLAECPQGVEHPFGSEIEPFSLCPVDPRSLELLADLYDQLLPHFSSRLFNVGLDETFDLGRGRSAEECAARGRRAVYLDFLRRVHRLVAERGRRMLFWGDIVLEQPELIEHLPRDAVALDWGYEADHPFAEETARLAASGLEFWVCPGTSSWNSFAGRADNALLNLSRAARAGHDSGAGGYLITDWGDFGHLQPLAVSYLGLLAGAGFAWNVDSGRRPLDIDIAALLDRHAFAGTGSSLGRVAVDLGNVYQATGKPVRNGTALFFLLLRGGPGADDAHLEGLSPAALTATLEHLEAAARPLAPDRGRPAEPTLAAEELAWAADVLAFACRYAGWRIGEAPRPPGRLASDLDDLLERLRPLWLARNRPGGLERSMALLERLRAGLPRPG